MELQVQKRQAGKVKKLLKQGLVPGVVYGKHLEEPILVQFNKNDFIKLYKQAGSSTPIELKGNVDQLVLIHDLQLEPVKDTLIHVDFLAVKKWEKVRAAVPVVIEGIDALQKQWLEANIVKDEIEVEAVPAKLPHNIKIDVSWLKDGDNITVADLKLGDDVEIITPAEEAIVVVSNPSAQLEDETSSTEETSEEETQS
jgi:large subunit ribosomal protein L25